MTTEFSTWYPEQGPYKLDPLRLLSFCHSININSNLWNSLSSQQEGIWSLIMCWFLTLMLTNSLMFCRNPFKFARLTWFITTYIYIFSDCPVLLQKQYFSSIMTIKNTKSCCGAFPSALTDTWTFRTFSGTMENLIWFYAS